MPSVGTGKHGSAEWTVFVVNGFNMLTAKPKAVTWKLASQMERSDGLGDLFEAETPTGLSRLTLTQAGAFWDTTVQGIHDKFKVPSTVPYTVLLGPAGQGPGAYALTIQGVLTVSYDVVSTVGQLTKANVAYQVNGPAAEGNVLQPYAVKSADWDTKTAPWDNGAATALGGTAYLTVAAMDAGVTSLVVTVLHSTDNVTYTTAGTFATVTIAPNQQQIPIAGTINRYVAIAGDITGTGTVTVSAMLHRN